jgi:hypothetical protein
MALWDWLPWRKKPEPPKFGGAGASGDFKPAEPALPTNVRLPRGVRNANPGNIERTSDNWQGLIGDDGRFCKFATAYYGIRALAIILLNYERKHGLRTVRSIISRWAPGKENDTEAYIRAVANDTHFPETKSLNLRDPGVLTPLVHAIIKHENGFNPYTVEYVEAAVVAALSTGL